MIFLLAIFIHKMEICSISKKKMNFLSSKISLSINFGFSDFLVGSWFDLITLSFFYLPFIIVCTLPLPDFVEGYRKIARIICYLPVTVLIFFLNAWDVAFFSFTRKRVSFNYFKFLFSENEAGGLAVEYMMEFWWLILLFILSLVFIFYLFFKSKFLGNRIGWTRGTYESSYSLVASNS